MKLSRKYTNSIKNLGVHPNVIIRKKLKSKAKIWKMILEIYDERIAGVYPTTTHTKRLKNHWIHKYTWDEYMGETSEKNYWKVKVEITEELGESIRWCQEVIGRYKMMDGQWRHVMEAVTLAIIRE